MMAGDVLTEFSYQAGDAVNTVVSGAVAPLSDKLDTVIDLLSPEISAAQQSTVDASPSPSTVSLKSFAANDPNIAIGMCRKTGKRLTALDHLKQSITIIITTLITSRVMRRTFGCSLFELIDQPQNEMTRVQIIAVIAEALDKWEPRFILSRVQVAASQAEQAAGKLYFTLAGKYRGKDIELGVLA